MVCLQCSVLFFCGVIQFLAIWLSCALFGSCPSIHRSFCVSVFFGIFFLFASFIPFSLYSLSFLSLSLQPPLFFSSLLSFSISIFLSVSFYYFILEQCRNFYCFSSALKRIYENWFSFGLWLTTHIRHVFIYIGTFAMGDIVLLSFYSTYLSKAK